MCTVFRSIKLNSFCYYFVQIQRNFWLKVNKLNSINTELSCGTTAVITLIYEGRLFVANVGDARALLCRTDSDGVLRVLQLSQDHVPSNEDEILRLTTLGIAKEKIHPGILSFICNMFI